MLPGVAVIGTGATVDRLVPVLKECGFKVEAIWGRTRELAEKSAKRLNIQFSTNKVDDVLLTKDVDLVVISCSPHFQSPIALKALGIGKHVICCPPAGLSQLEVFKMVTAARYYPSLMAVMGYGLRFLPAFQKAREMIEVGSIGDVTICEVQVHCGSLIGDKYNWMCDEIMGGGVLNAYGGVIIDLISYLMGRHRAVQVNGMLKTFIKNTQNIQGVRQITSDDYCSFQMELENGVCVNVMLNSQVSGKFTHEVLVCGTLGRLRAKGADLYLFNNNTKVEERVHREGLEYSEYTRLTEPQEMPLLYIQGLTRLVNVVKDAFKSLEERHAWSKDPVTLAATFEDALYIQTVIDAIRTSSKKRQWVKVEVITEEPDPNPFLSAAVRRSTFSF